MSDNGEDQSGILLPEGAEIKSEIIIRKLSLNSLTFPPKSWYVFTEARPNVFSNFKSDANRADGL